MPDSPNLLVNSPNVSEQAISLIHSLAFRTKLNVKVLGYIRNSLYISIRKLRDMKTIEITVTGLKDLSSEETFDLFKVVLDSVGESADDVTLTLTEKDIQERDDYDPSEEWEDDWTKDR
jgi:hypothetical protein